MYRIKSKTLPVRRESSDKHSSVTGTGKKFNTAINKFQNMIKSGRPYDGDIIRYAK